MSDLTPTPLLMDVIDHPDDDAPRLVWGDVAGGERGELVTIQCALSAGALPPDRLEALRRREAELLAVHQSRWSGLVGVAGGCRFHRGFLDAAEIDATTLLAHDVEILAAAPLLRRLTVTGLTGNNDAEGVLTGPQDVPALVERVLGSPILDALEGLELVSPGTSWQSDSEFHGSGFDGLGDEVAALLSRSGRLGRLKELGITRARIGPAGARTLAAAGLGQIERLWLEGQEIGDEAALELLAPGRLPRLRSLKLTGQNDNTRRHLSGKVAPLLPARLVDLQLDWNGLRDDSLLELAASPPAPTLQRLAIGHGWYRAEGLAALARFRALHTLDLDGGSLASTGEPGPRSAAVRAVASLEMPALRSLRLSSCFLEEDDARALVAGVGRTLEVLDLRHNWKLKAIQDELARGLGGSCRLVVGGEGDRRESMFGT